MKLLSFNCITNFFYVHYSPYLKKIAFKFGVILLWRSTILNSPMCSNRKLVRNENHFVSMVTVLHNYYVAKLLNLHNYDIKLFKTFVVQQRYEVNINTEIPSVLLSIHP